MPGHGLEIAGNISEAEPDLEAVRASRPDQSDCFFGPNVIELCRMADITFIGLHGGEGENGKLQAAFDLLGIRYTGPDSLGCAVAMDKGLTKALKPAWTRPRASACTGTLPTVLSHPPGSPFRWS